MDHLGLAMGVLGLSFGDFCLLRLDEYASIMRHWRASRESALRDDWERMRTLATISIQPHVRKKIAADRLIPLPWDKRRKKKKKNSTTPTKSYAERRKEAEEFLRRVTQ